MNRKEVVKLLIRIKNSWLPKWEVNDEMISAWYESLKDEDNDEVINALEQFSHSEYYRNAPTVRDFLRELSKSSRRRASGDVKTLSREEYEDALKAYRERGYVPIHTKEYAPGRRPLVFKRIEECCACINTGRYFWKQDILSRWCPFEWSQECYSFWGVSKTSPSLLSVLGNIKPDSQKMTEWRHREDVLLDVALERLEDATGRRLIRAESYEEFLETEKVRELEVNTG